MLGRTVSSPRFGSQLTGRLRYGALKTSFEAKRSGENLTARRRGRRVAGVRGRRIRHRADRACTSAGHTASRHHAQRGGNLRRQPGDVLCLRQGKRRVRRTRATCSPRLWRLRLQGLRSARSRLRRLRRLPRLPRLRGAILWLWRLWLWRLRLRLPGVDRPDLGLDLLAGHETSFERRLELRLCAAAPAQGRRGCAEALRKGHAGLVERLLPLTAGVSRFPDTSA